MEGAITSLKKKRIFCTSFQVSGQLASVAPLQGHSYPRNPLYITALLDFLLMYGRVLHCMLVLDVIYLSVC